MDDAIAREKQIKGSSRASKIALIQATEFGMERPP